MANVKSRVFKTILFLILVTGFDRIVGHTCENIYNKSNDYTIAKLRYTLDSTNQDILIFGSSRAMNQFNSVIIEKNTGLSTYNCGFGGQGLLFSYIQLNESLKRYTPKIVILDISPNILLDPESSDKLKILLPYYERDTLIYNRLTNNNYREKLKFLSSIYPYNSTIISLARRYNSQFRDTLKGFIPIDRTIDTTNLDAAISRQFPETEIPAAKFNYLDQIVSLCEEKEVPLVLVMCPVYRLNENLEKMNGQITEYCKNNYPEVHFADYTKHALFLENARYFSDNLHLNNTGAQLFTNEIAMVLSQIIFAKKESIQNK
jgi:hypothetical protein